MTPSSDHDQDTPDRRSALLEKIVDHVLEHGIADLTLRGLSATTGSNNRMLLYYFGSRDGIIVAALPAAAQRFPKVESLLTIIDDPSLDTGQRLETAWAAIAHPSNLPFHRLFFEVFGLAAFERGAFEDVLTTIGTEWAAHVRASFVRDGFDDDDALLAASEVVALWRGLQATLISTGDHDLVDRVASAAGAALVERLHRTR